MSDKMNIPNTGIAELDNILADKDGLSIEPMPIDKGMFDNVLLPLLRNELSITTDESFTHIRNIWINYYNHYSTNRMVVFKENSGLSPKSMSGNAVFTPMIIKDSKGETIATTPPLLEPSLIVGMNNILEEYGNEMKHNPMVAKTKLVNTIKQYTISTSQAWIDFLNSYSLIVADNNIADDNDDLIIRS